MEEKRWNIVTGGAIPYNGSAPSEAMVEAAGELQKQKILDTARAPWAPTQLRASLPVTHAQAAAAGQEGVVEHANALASPSAGLTGWRRSLTGKFSAPSAAEFAQPRLASAISIEQDNSSTNAYLYQRAVVAAGTLYTLRVKAAVSSGAATAGVAFYNASGAIIAAPATDLESKNTTTRTFSVTAPLGVMAASVYVGKFDGTGGDVKLAEASFGAAASATINVNTGSWIRHMSPSGPGIVVNYWNDGPGSAYNNYGNGYFSALHSLSPGTLRYPGGEKSDSYAWAPPPWTSSTKPRPTLTRSQPNDWPFSDKGVFDYATNPVNYRNPPLDFDTFMSYVKATSAEPYLVLNYDSCNYILGPNDWSYDQLFALAKSWLTYIAQMGYKVVRFEFSNESYLSVYNGKARAGDYAWSLGHWALALKAILPNMLLGANGYPSWDAVGAADHEVGSSTYWWQQVFSQSGSSIGFLALHSYPIFNQNYNDYSYSNPNFQAHANAGQYILQRWASPADAQRIRLSFTETGVEDWAYKWPGYPCNLGMGIATFDILAQLISHPAVDDAHVWTTRWRTGAPNPSQSTANTDAFKGDNTLSPIGLAVAIAGKYMRTGDLVQSDSLYQIRSWAVMTPGYQGIHLMLLNRGFTAVSQPIQFNSYGGNRNNGQLWVFGAHSGFTSSPDTDTSPTFVQISTSLQIVNNQLIVQLKPVSLTVIVF
ncbi:hypothetical protein WJX81_003290 [Elliptochloris bilobata]|uniref:Uncharacterized protein n=1 Tax=Elliptochloris bilobata TaxID=381761 RepID=A0AAW1QP92_9CHLO